MELKFSKIKNIPYLEFENGKIIFSDSTKISGKYKYLVWNITFKFNKDLKKGSKRIKISNTIDENFITDIDMSGIPKEAKKHPLLSKVNIREMKKIFKRNSENGLISNEQVVRIGKELENYFQ